MPIVAGQATTWNVFYYTDLNALISIIHKDCIVLRTTNVLYQNDPHEIVGGVNIVNKIEKDQNIVAGAFCSYYIYELVVEHLVCVHLHQLHFMVPALCILKKRRQS